VGRRGMNWGSEAKEGRAREEREDATHHHEQLLARPRLRSCPQVGQ